MDCKYCGREVPQGVDYSIAIGGNTLNFCSEDCRTLWDLNRKRKAAEGRAKKQAEKKAKAEALAEIKEEVTKMKTAEVVELSKSLDPMEESYHIVQGIKSEYGEQATEILINLMLRLNNDVALANKYSEVETVYRKAIEILDGTDEPLRAMLRRLL